MASKRIVRVNELIKREIAGYLSRLVHGGDLDWSAITVTQVSTAPNLRYARVMVSIRDHELERRDMLATIRSQRAAIQKHIAQTVRLKYTPQLDFVLDASIEKGDRVLNLMTELEEQYGIPPPETTGSESD